MRTMQSLLGLSLLVLLSVGVAQGRSPRPLGTFATAVSDEKKEDAAEEAFSPEQGKQMESIKSIMKAATQEEGRAADPRLSIADLLEAINHLEEKRQDSALQHPAKKSESSTKTDVSILANPIVKKTQEGIFAHGVAGSSNDWFNTQGNLFAKKPVQFAGHPNLKAASQKKKHYVKSSKPAQKNSIQQGNDIVGFRSSEINPEIVFGFEDAGKEKGLEEDEVCMTMSAEIEEIAYNDELTCVHKEFESCHDTFKSVLRKSMIEKCETDYIKECNIDYEVRSKSVKMEVCKESWVRDCELEGDEVCTMEEDAICEKEFHEVEVPEMVTECSTVEEEVCFNNPETNQEVCKSFPKQKCEVVNRTRKEFVPEVKCKKLMTPVCGPESCPLTRSEPICSDEVKEVTVEVPRERCDLIPQKMCSQVPKFVPSLQSVKVCNKVPKEVCHKERTNPRSAKKTIPKKWCGKNKCEKNSQFGTTYEEEIDSTDGQVCSDACKAADNCDFFFWTGEEGIFGVEATKNKCRFGKYSEGQTYLEIKMSMSPLEGAVSGFKGCQIEIEQ